MIRKTKVGNTMNCFNYTKQENQCLSEKDIKHRILVIKINKRYREGMDKTDLYNSVRGVWRISKDRVREIEYVFGVYKSVIVAVYRPSQWFVCKEALDNLPRQDVNLTPNYEDRLFFIDECYEHGEYPDENEEFYLGKSIELFKKNQKAQNPVTYLYPMQ